MSAIGKPPGPHRQSEENPFRYGYRYVERTDKQGRLTSVMVPLTEADVLHPRLEDHVTQNQAHTQDCFYILGACQTQLADDSTAQVFCDHLVKWDVAGIGDHGPDIVVVFGARRLAQRASFDVAEEGVRPQVIIEVTSPSTRNSDLNVKPRQYWRCRVPCLVIVDELPRRRQRQLRILGFRRGSRGYQRLPLSPEGRLWLEPLRLWLGQENGRVVCYKENGQPILNYVEEAQARQEAEQRAEQEAQARQQAEAEVARLQEELRRLRGEK